MEPTEIKYLIEAALLAADRPLNIDQIKALFDDAGEINNSELRKAIEALNSDYEGRGIEVTEVASGFRMQVRANMADKLQKLWEERPPRYSRALFETLALIAYRQPMTRGEIEEVRGVAVSTNIVRTMLEREWIRVVGHRDVPGRPALFGTTKLFLDYFGLKRLDDLPPLADLSDWETLRVQLNLPEVEENPVAVEGADVTALADAAVDGHTDESRLSQLTADDVLGAADEGTDSELPILQPEMEAEADAGTAEDSGADDDFEELIVTEWPDPVSVAAKEASDDSDADEADAKATSG